MRKTRIIQWIFIIIVALLLIFFENSIMEFLLTEKTPVTLYAPKEMETAFKKALKASNLSNCKIVLTDDPNNADICVEYGKENDSKYVQFAYSPFAIGYSTSDKAFKNLKNSELIIPSEYNNNFYEIDLLKVVDEVIEEGKWSNLGIEDLGNIRVFYPAETTDYWHDFYNFMLVTVNNGKYPSTSDEMTKAVEYVEQFLNSSYTEAVVNFNEKVKRTDGFNSNCIYIIPEEKIKHISYEDSEFVRLVFPLYTTYCYYYVIGNTENGTAVVNAINNSDSFFLKLKYNDYRNSTYYELGDCYRRVYDECDIYNLVNVPKENFFTSN